MDVSHGHRLSCKKKLDDIAQNATSYSEESWKQHPTKQLLYGHLYPVSKTIQIRLTKNDWDCWRDKDQLISDVLLWIHWQ